MSKSGPAYRNKRNSLKEKKETTTTANATAVVADPTIEIQRLENAVWIARIGTLIRGPALTPKAVCDAHAELKRHAATWAQAFYVWKHASGGMNQAGGFVKIIREWELYTASVSFPICFECEDVGSRDEKFPCTCVAAEKWLQKHPEAFARADARQKGIDFCEACKSTGTTPLDLHCQCPIGRQLAEDHEKTVRAAAAARTLKEQEAKAREEEFNSRGVCHLCEGTKQFDGQLCRTCHSTGLFLVPREISAESAGGSGKLWGFSKCRGCPTCCIRVLCSPIVCGEPVAAVSSNKPLPRHSDPSAAP